jgi:hypothetical protein
MERSCSKCDGPMTSGSIGSVRDPTMLWSAAQTKSSGRVRISTSSGPRVPIAAWRCDNCGLLELVAE